ncbi:GUN4 domain-containing protein [Pseudanabaena sp. BC1403]|uniref:protein kinase domain-containing protein n=1 Tax=Pseudanabaena sp. BC1403 TaxID=2043171 RepID=UPI000CD82D11|nr:GUN4 domain-containing protein [Pseudanabaena sp. BC1403]
MPEQMLIDRFRIVKQISFGAFGETFLAEDTHKRLKNQASSQCVVKRLITKTDPDQIAITRQMFEREASKLDDLNHSGIPKLIAYFEDNDQFYLVQEFIDGRPLSDEINHTVKWSESRTRGLLREVLEILAYVHSQGSIHRDLKPSNIMRRRANDKIVLIDFGAVREVQPNQTNMAFGLASGTIAIGTLGYMPAEQTQGRPCFASDIHAVGCMAIEALTAEPPYGHGFEQDAETGEFRWRHKAQVSDDFVEFIDKMVRYDFRQRYRNAEQALTDLQSLKPIALPLETIIIPPLEIARTSPEEAENTRLSKQLIQPLQETVPSSPDSLPTIIVSAPEVTRTSPQEVQNARPPEQSIQPLQEVIISSPDLLPNTFVGYRKLLTMLVSDLEKLRGYAQTLWLSSSTQFQNINSVIERVQSKSFSIAVVGIFKRGKSTFINALLGEDILPSDVNPCTATLNRITYGVNPRVQIIYKNGREEEIRIDQLYDYVTNLTPESEDKAAHIREAIVQYPVQYCQNNVDIIDTPGLNNDDSMTEVTLSMLPLVDVAIMVIWGNAPFGESEQKFLENDLLTNDLGRIIFVVTAIDRYGSLEDANKGVKYVRDRIKRLVLQRAKDQYGEDSPEYEVYKNKIGEIKIFGLSAYQALKAKQTDDTELLAKSCFPEFEAAFEKFLTQERDVVFLQVTINRLITFATEILTALNLRQSTSPTLNEQQQRNIIQMMTETQKILGNAHRFSKKLNDNDSSQASNTNTSTEGLDDDLRSECNADYTRLRELLKSQKWEEANQETALMMLKVAGCEKEGWIDSNAIDCFPIKDLKTIDQLWLKYTNGHFGFSVQKKIFKQVNQKERDFLQQVNWTNASLHGGIFLGENNLKFTLDAPEGHLPMVFGGEHNWIFTAL